MKEKKIRNFEVVEMCVTSRCNLKCTHCYQSFEKNKFQLSFKQIKNIVDYVSLHNGEKFVLSGGEFFIHPNAYEILSYIINTTGALITCVTNLTLVDVEKLKEVAPSERISFKVSIDGDEEQHDKRRGKGMFAITVNKIHELRKAGYTVEITMTLVEENIHCIPSVFANDTFGKVTLLPVATTGEACYNFQQDKDSQLYNDVICHIYKTCRKYVDGEHRCYIFPNSFSVKYDGGIYPCSLSRDYDLCKMGDISDNDISQVMQAFMASPESNMFFEYEKNAQIDMCNHCSQNTECTRGCRIRAYKWNGSLLSNDPFACKIFKGTYQDIPFGEIYWGSKK